MNRLRAEFEAAHKRRFGFIAENKALVIDAVEVEAVGGGAGETESAQSLDSDLEAATAKRARFFSQGAWHDAGVVLREQMQRGQTVTGPAIIIEKTRPSSSKMAGRPA